MARPKKTQAIEDTDWDSEEEEQPAPSQVVTEFKPEPAVTEKYVYLRIHKLWGQVNLLGEFPLKSGVTFMEPYAYEIVVAWQRPGKDRVDEPLRPGTISWDEWEKLTGAMESVQQRSLGRIYASEANQTAF